MRVFWSWQSDLDGGTCRHFIKAALMEAIGDLEAELKREEQTNPASRFVSTDVVIDHDRKDVPGIPDLAATLFAKIAESDVFVADATPIGKTERAPPKLVMNPNVAIELGYALGSLGDRKILLVLNAHYSSMEQMPFDLRHKAGPILYNLPPDATKEAKVLEKRKLAGEFKHRLRAIASNMVPPLQEVPARADDRSRYFDDTKALAKLPGKGETSLFVPAAPLIYVRLKPTKSVKQLTTDGLTRLLANRVRQLPAFGLEAREEITQPNEFGAIAFDHDAVSPRIRSAIQIFPNREIWAFNSMLLLSRNGEKMWPTVAVERTLSTHIPALVAFCSDALDNRFPLHLEIGATRIQGYRILLPMRGAANASEVVINEKEIWTAMRLGSTAKEQVESVLSRFFCRVFDAAGAQRPAEMNAAVQ